MAIQNLQRFASPKHSCWGVVLPEKGGSACARPVSCPSARQLAQPGQVQDRGAPKAAENQIVAIRLGIHPSGHANGSPEEIAMTNVDVRFSRSGVIVDPAVELTRTGFQEANVPADTDWTSQSPAIGSVR